MKFTKYLLSILLMFAFNAQAGVIGKMIGKAAVATAGGTVGGIIGSTTAQAKTEKSVEQNVQELVSAMNSTYQFPVKLSDLTYLVAVANEDRTIMFFYLFNVNETAIDATLNEELRQAVASDSYRIHSTQCQNKAMYDNLLSKGALFNYRYYISGTKEIYSTTLSVSDCRF